MKLDRYYERMADTWIIHGVIGYVVFRLIETPRRSLQIAKFPLLGYAAGALAGGMARGFGPTWWKAQALVFPLLILVMAALTFLSLVVDWANGLRDGTMDKAPDWPTWKRWRKTSSARPHP